MKGEYCSSEMVAFLSLNQSLGSNTAQNNIIFFFLGELPSGHMLGGFRAGGGGGGRGSCPSGHMLALPMVAV